jgi:uncharacterized membrane protein
MSKRGQLGIIEFKYFIVGLIVGLIGGIILVNLGRTKAIPFSIPVCSSLASCAPAWLKLGKKGQLGIIEFKYFVVGVIVGIILSFILIYLGAKKAIPFQIPFACPAVAAKS